MGKKSKKSNKKSNGGKGQQQQQQRQQPPPTRSSLRLNPNHTPTDANSNNTLSTANATTTTAPTNVSSTTQLDNSELKRRGIDPTTGLELETCICPDSTKCKELMWRLAAINDESMFPYLSLPGDPAKPNSDTGQHMTGYRENVFKHLYAEVIGDVVEGLPKKQYVALLHFKPEIRKHLISTLDQSRKQFKWRVPVDVAYANGLDTSDLCKTPDINGEEGKTCFASPNQSLKDAKREIQEKERLYNEQKAAANPSIAQEDNNDNARSPVRKNPAARELDRLEREAAANPRAAALKQQQQNDTIESLKAEIAELKKMAVTTEKTHTKEMESQHELLTAQLVEGGLNRKALINDDYHKNKPWLSKYLYGRPWEAHKAIGEACFGDIVEGFTCDVNGEGEITPFEKYSIVCMAARKGIEQPAFAAIYDRSQPSISRYWKEWMPRLGKIGGFMSELSLEMNHNMVSIDDCKENSILYMDNGEMYRNGDVQDVDKL